MPPFAITFSHIHSLILLLLLLLLSYLQPLSSNFVFPPPGNSIAIRGAAFDGKLKYMCEKDGGEWVLLQKKATLRDQANHTKIIGYYSSNFGRGHSSMHVGTWALLNNEGDQAESGQPMSLVSGKQIAIMQNGRNELPDFLARASLHRSEGAARSVSYIAQMNATMASQLPSLQCKESKATLSIEYKAKYVFWRQDLLPPKVPTILAVPTKHQPVQAFFAQGVIKYIYDQKMQLWRQHRVLARLYDVPGGVQMGGFSYNITLPVLANLSHQHSNYDLACIIINNPNGFQVCGQQRAATAMRVNQSSCPWFLFNVTSSNGYITKILGPFSFVQMVSTWGGLPPQDLQITNIDTPYQVWKSSFTAVLWLYTSRGA